MIQVHQTSITSAQVLLLNTTPIIVLPTPPVGYINNILGVSINLVYNSVAYATHTTLDVYDTFASTALAFFSDALVLARTANSNAPFLKQYDPSQGILSTTGSISIYVAAGNPTAGNSPIVISVIYEQVIIQ